LGCEVDALGWVGEDEAGARVKQMFQAQGIDDQGLISLDRPTILKDRILTQQQQLVRVDFESKTALSREERECIQTRAMQLLERAQAVVLSDYAKGILDPALVKLLIDKAREKRIPIICDPGRGVPLERYQGVTTIKPNRMETELATGIQIKDQSSMLAAAGLVKEKTGAEFLSMSLDREGILYYESDDNWQLLETQAREVYDVTGAGDMVVSVISCLLTQGASPVECLAMANVAAEIEIGHMGVVSIPWGEIKDYLVQGRLEKKLAKVEDIQQDLLGLKEDVVFANGYFDNLSAGHLRFLIEAARLPGRLVVAINSDAGIERAKGKRPILSEADRARLLASLEDVWRVVIFDEDHAGHLIEQLRPAIVVKGEDFQGKEISESEAIIAVGARIEYISHFSYN